MARAVSLRRFRRVVSRAFRSEETVAFAERKSVEQTPLFFFSLFSQEKKDLLARFARLASLRGTRVCVASSGERGGDGADVVSDLVARHLLAVPGGESQRQNPRESRVLGAIAALGRASLAHIILHTLSTLAFECSETLWSGGCMMDL